jgi:hypothetical protein
MRSILLAICTFVVGLAMATPASAALSVDNVNGVRVEAQFVDGNGPSADDPGPVLNRIVQMIDNTPSGESIVAGLYGIDVPAVRDAFARAVARGVNVKMVQSGNQPGPNAPCCDLHAVLGANHVPCRYVDGSGNTVNNSCLSTRPGAIQHAKYMLFSKTTDTSGVLRSNVSWFGTANLAYSSGSQSVNDTITTYGDGELFNNLFWHLFVFQWSMARNDDYNATSNGVTTSAATGVEIQAAPSADDLLVEQLNRVTAGPDCKIRVMEYAFTRTALANKLRSMNLGQCNVWVLVDHVSCAVKSILQNSTISLKQRFWVHSKTMILHGQGLHDVILTGSHNASIDTLFNDELLARVPVDAPLENIYSGYVAAFNRTWATASTTVPCD